MAKRTIKTYACKNAITNSKPVTQKIIAKGTKDKINHIDPAENILQTNPIKIFINIWPDIIFANNRIDRLKIREKYEIYSIIINNGIINKGKVA
mgnify:CR=1 FL=1